MNFRSTNLRSSRALDLASMAEPVPSASTAADNADNEETARLPKNAEDRKAAAALNSLNANEISQDDTEAGAAKKPSTLDQAALGEAMNRLEIASGSGAKKDTKKEDKKAELEVKKKIRIASEDVNLLVSLKLFSVFVGDIVDRGQVDQLDLTKAKATELLRAHDGNATKAIRAFILPPVRA